MVVCFIGALLSVGLLVGLIFAANNNNNDSSDTSDVCLTSACIHESSMVLKNMNLDANP
jgi:hypothetical protein